MPHQIKSLNKFNPATLISFDIETARAEKELPIEGSLYRAWSRLRSNEGKSYEELNASYKKEAALHAEFSRVVAFSATRLTLRGAEYQVETLAQLSGLDESQLLQQIGVFLSRKTGVLAGMAIVGYDIPFLIKRYLANGMPVPVQLDLTDCKPWEVGVFDLLNIWKMTSFHSSPLESICFALGIPSPKDGDVCGNSVGDYLFDERIPLAERLAGISFYCTKDCVAVSLCISKMFQLPIAKESLSTADGVVVSVEEGYL
jgi:hypothetical protein